ncbi:hypothetical protein QBC38DRAFT_507820 [Podospora fimiseda]|uniref:Uncharacterized protein n=1 Tax=Podospora fimiseda TaxID=252190 RepID=A0AAN7BUL9_9PEZI|nr:hypothetical protein QBC38DRAFT_507820 [Podospora fimiseda]
MAATISNEALTYSRAGIESLNPEDFETASIRSAAPSYTSDAPSYHTVAPHPDPVPPYTPPASSNSQPSSRPSTSLVSSLLGPPPASESTRGRGLPPVPSGPIRHPEPSINQFRTPRIPTWSRIGSNPTARHYHNVANRRAASSTSSFSSFSSTNSSQIDITRGVLDRIEEDEQPHRSRIHALEDPILVGEEAARRARQSRLARESGDDILIRENLSWDWFLGELSRRHRRR